MQNSLIKDIIEKLNQDIVCNEYIFEQNQGEIVENDDYKSVEKYIKLFIEKKIEIKKENIDKLNEILCKDYLNDEETLKMDSLLYVNIKDGKIYFYSFEGFSDEFIYTYRNMKNCSFIRFLFDKYFEENNEIKNIQDYISIKVREYINFLADKIENTSKCDSIDQNQAYLNNLYDEINYISTLTYEGSNVSAKILLLNKSLFNDYIKFYIELEEPIDFEKYRKVRKLLETSDKTTYLIGDNKKVYGLGRLKNISDFQNDLNMFIIDFLGRFEYKISTLFCSCSIIRSDVNNNEELKKYSLKENTVVNVRYGKPDLKEYRYSESDFCGAVKNIFEDDFNENCDRKIELLKKIINCAKEQKHGTTVVITTPEIAKEETIKLEKQSIKIKSIDFEDNEYLVKIINRVTIQL